MTEFKATIKMKIPEVQFHASDNLTQDELETEVFRAIFDTVSARLGKELSECSIEEQLSEIYEIQIERVGMKTPCNTGFNCPYWSHDEDGMGLCTAPEVTEKKGRHYVYPLVMTLEICPMVVDYSPIGKWLKSLDKEAKE